MCWVYLRDIGEGFIDKVVFELIYIGECSRKGIGILSKQKGFCKSMERYEDS